MQQSKINVFLLCALIVSLGVISYLYLQKRDVGARYMMATAEQTLEAVARHLVLPTEEVPTVATITSLEELRDQPFFINAKVGDRVLIYIEARKAILYDPVADRIVEVAPLSLEDVSDF